MSETRSVQRSSQRAEMRRRHRRLGTDKFYIDPALIPEHMHWEWKRLSVLGQEDRSHQVALERLGWEPVPAALGGDLMGKPSASGHIEMDGQILMQIPREEIEEARAEDYDRAQGAVQQRMAAMKADPKLNKGKGVRRTYEAPPDE